jgi:hypothetical protein
LAAFLFANQKQVEGGYTQCDNIEVPIEIQDNKSHYEYTAPPGYKILRVVVDGKVYDKTFYSDGEDYCWRASGIGTQSASLDKKHTLGCGINKVTFYKMYCPGPTTTPSPTPSPTVTPTPTPKPSCTPKLTPTPIPSVTLTPTPIPSVTPSVTPEVTPTPGEPSLTPVPTNEPPRGGPPGAPVCTDTVPPAPTMVSVTKQDADSFLVNWTKVNPASHYTLVYGPTSGNYPYSVFDTGNTDNFVVNGMAKGCFAVKAVNGCQPGPLSNELCSGAQPNVLGASTLGATGSASENLQNILFLFIPLYGNWCKKICTKTFKIITCPHGRVA